MYRVKEGSCALCVVAVEPCIVELCFIHQNIGETNIFSDDTTLMTLLKTSDML